MLYMVLRKIPIDNILRYIPIIGKTKERGRNQEQ